jgi:hypothetical protein
MISNLKTHKVIKPVEAKITPTCQGCQKLLNFRHFASNQLKLLQLHN